MIRRNFLALIAGALVLSAQGRAPSRYIVELEGEPAIAALRTPAERGLSMAGRESMLEGRRGRIRSEQAGVERALRGRGIKVLNRVETVANALIVEASEVSAFAGIAGIRRIEPEREYQLFMDRAVSIHQVEKAWDQIGGFAKAGEGIKVGIVDTGIDPRHPGFLSPDLPVPDGYPKFNGSANSQIVSNKIIVARSFGSSSVRDQIGHGTAVAMCAAGERHEGPIGVLSGVAPRAWLGVYRVDNPATGGIPTSNVLNALDAAFNDGMDVLNMSFGLVGSAGAISDQVAGAARRVAESGVIIVNAAGNTPGPMTVDDSAADEKTLAVGASYSDRALLTPAVIPSSGSAVRAEASSNAARTYPVSGPLVEILALDPSELACDPLPAGSLTGKIPLIKRGTCFFHQKLANAAAAGAPAAVVYNNPDRADPETLIVMDVTDNPTIPGLHVTNSGGRTLKSLITSVEELKAVLRFGIVPLDPALIASFSSTGPSVDLLIKPDLVADGVYVYTAAMMQPYDPNICLVCADSGYVIENGTSFSSPIVAGAAALLKSARPGLSAGDYRSLLVNASTPLAKPDGQPQAVQVAGAGSLNVWSALNSTISAAPWSVSFGGGPGTLDLSRRVFLKNLGTETAAFTLSVDSTNEVRPALSTDTLTVGPGEAVDLTVTLTGTDLAPGTYEGFLRVKSSISDIEARIPYWYAVRGDGPPASIVVVYSPRSGAPNAKIDVYLRVHEASGLSMVNPDLKVTPVTGGGAVLDVKPDPASGPDIWKATLQLGSRSGVNSFRAEAGSAQATFSITGS